MTRDWEARIALERFYWRERENRKRLIERMVLWMRNFFAWVAPKKIDSDKEKAKLGD